jgi:hypothetical protein
MTPSEWLEIHLRGAVGSDQRTARWLQDALDPEQPLEASAKAIEKLRETIEARDSDFFYEIARGLEALNKKEQALLNDPRYHLACAYDLLCDQKGAPTKRELVEMAKRHWAVKQVFRNSLFVIPTMRFNAEKEKEIARSIEQLPVIKWNRYYLELGLDHLPEAKAGPKAKER